MVLTKEYCTDYLHKLELNLNKEKVKGLKYNIENSFFRQPKTEHLGFWVTRDGAKIMDKQIK